MVKSVNSKSTRSVGRSIAPSLTAASRSLSVTVPSSVPMIVTLPLVTSISSANVSFEESSRSAVKTTDQTGGVAPKVIVQTSVTSSFG